MHFLDPVSASGILQVFGSTSSACEPQLCPGSRGAEAFIILVQDYPLWRSYSERFLGFVRTSLFSTQNAVVTISSRPIALLAHQRARTPATQALLVYSKGSVFDSVAQYPCGSCRIFSLSADSETNSSSGGSGRSALSVTTPHGLGL